MADGRQSEYQRAHAVVPLTVVLRMGASHTVSADKALRIETCSEEPSG